MSEYCCAYCKRDIPKIIVDKAKQSLIPVRCPCRPGSLNPSEMFNGVTVVWRKEQSNEQD